MTHFFEKNTSWPIGVHEYHEKKEKNELSIEIEPIISRYMWNKVNKNKGS